MVRYITMALLFAFAVLAYNHAYAADGEMTYSSRNGVWSPFIGNCQLKVQTSGASAYYMPVGNSGEKFEGARPETLIASSAPVESVREYKRGLNQIVETLKVFFVVKDGETHPSRYTLKREYRRGDLSTGSIEVQCMNLEADRI